MWKRRSWKHYEELCLKSENGGQWISQNRFFFNLIFTVFKIYMVKFCNFSRKIVKFSFNITINVWFLLCDSEIVDIALEFFFALLIMYLCIWCKVLLCVFFISWCQVFFLRKNQYVTMNLNSEFLLKNI